MNKTFVTAGCLILAFVIGFVLVWPKYQSFQALQSNIEKKEQELEAKGQYFSKIKDTYQTLAEHEESLAKISSALPETPSLPALFDFLQKTSSQTGLLLEDISFGGSASLEGEGVLREIQIRCNLIGNYSSFKDFLYALETSSRIFEVENISFNAPEELAEDISFAIEIKTYSQ